MCPAKVITPQGITFFVKENNEIHKVPEYDGLPIEDKKYLAFSLIIGTEQGFKIRKIRSDKREDIEVTENCPPLILPEGTRIEAQSLQKPSLREK